MNFVIRQFKNLIQMIVDKVNGKPIDRIGYVMYAIIGIMTMYVSFTITQLVKTPVIERPIHPNIYGILIVLPLLTFYLTLTGEKLKKSSTRISQFLVVILSTSVFAIGYIFQISNTTFVGWLNNIENIEVIPFDMLIGNIRVVTFFFPLVLILPMLLLTTKLIKEKDTRKVIAEYEIELLLPNVMESNDVTIDLEICEDSMTGDKCVVPEKKLFESLWLQGSSGSGKTATVIRPLLGQLFRMKAYLIEEQKKLAIEALKEGLAVLTQPVSNYYFNKNFNIHLIVPKEGKEEEYKAKFEKFIIGVRDKEEIVLEHKGADGNLSVRKPKSDSRLIVKVEILLGSTPIGEKTVTLKSSDESISFKVHDKYEEIRIFNKAAITNEEEQEKHADKVARSQITEEMKEEYTILLPKLEDSYTYRLVAREKGSGQIIYRNLGITVVAPDGGLPADTIKIADQYGITVHKIDPSMDEIKKGKIAKLNPLLGGRPEKKGDIIASILASMEESDGAKSGAYFVNASVRAVRNVVILLKVMYPIMEKREPNLNDVLAILNDFNSVVPYVEGMKRSAELKRRWSSVISYFETSFYPPETDDRGRVMPGTRFGSKRQKTLEAIEGVVNQLDNFLGRDEVQYILCDTKESIDLADVLFKGDCIAIATRQNNLGARLGKAFALFFILSLQNEVLSRYSEDENPEIPHFLIIDEFPMYVNENTKTFFTFARKYKTSTTIAIQNMGQLKTVSDEFGETIFANTNTKVLLPGANVEDKKYWAAYFGTEEKFEMQTGVTTTSMWSDNPNYSEQRRGTLTSKNVVGEQDIGNLNFKEAFYSYTNFKGRRKIGKGNTDFLHNQKIKSVKTKEYDFEKYNPYSFEKFVKEQEKNKTVKTENTDTETISTTSDSLEFEGNNDTIDNSISSTQAQETRFATSQVNTDKEDTNFHIVGNGKQNFDGIDDVNELSFDDPNFTPGGHNNGEVITPIIFEEETTQSDINNQKEVIDTNTLQFGQEGEDIVVESSSKNSDYLREDNKEFTVYNNLDIELPLSTKIDTKENDTKKKEGLVVDPTNTEVCALNFDESGTKENNNTEGNKSNNDIINIEDEFVLEGDM